MHARLLTARQPANAETYSQIVLALSTQARDGVDVMMLRCALPLGLASIAFATAPATWVPLTAAAAVCAVAAVPDTVSSWLLFLFLSSMSVDIHLLQQLLFVLYLQP